MPSRIFLQINGRALKTLPYKYLKLLAFRSRFFGRGIKRAVAGKHYYLSVFGIFLKIFKRRFRPFIVILGMGIVKLYRQALGIFKYQVGQRKPKA